jgi:hypothetical protein
MSMYRLPVSGIEVLVQQPTGREDLLLQEAADFDMHLVFDLFERLVELPQGAPRNWDEFAVTDLETLLLLLRRAVLGDRIWAETECTAAECKARVDVSFGLEEYLASVKPRVPRGVQRIDGEYPYLLRAGEVRFRLLNGADLAALERHVVAERALVRNCICPPGVRAPVRHQIERAMHALAPRLSRVMSGQCPECQATLSFHFDVVRFVLRELRNHGATIFEDVHLLAAHYKWPEEAILALPRSRRLRYGEALREHRSAA